MAQSPVVQSRWHPDKKHSDVERWICIYPAYINSKKTRQEGRRLPKENCVDSPLSMEMRDVLSVTGLHVGVENKQYSREKSRELQYRGRIRVQMRNDDGTLCDPKFPTRQAIMLHIANKIPQLKSRQNKPGDFSQPHTQSQPQQTSGGGGGGKKGKGRRR